MTAFAVSLLLAPLVLQSPGADTLRLLAGRMPEAALVLEVRSHPLVVRDALADALRQAVKGPTEGDRQEQLAAARALAAAYAGAWSDSFLIREVARFEAWP